MIVIWFSSSPEKLTSGTITSGSTRMDFFPSRNMSGRLENRSSLHLRDFGIGNAEATPPVPKHRILLVQRLDPIGDQFGGNAESLGEGVARGDILWKELVEWGVEKADSNGTITHGAEDPYKIFPLEG